MFLEEETLLDEDRQVSVKALYGIYRIWSEERGEKPLATIRFTRKLQDRGEKITGTGANATLFGKYIPPRAVPNTDVNWGDVSSMAGRF